MAIAVVPLESTLGAVVEGVTIRELDDASSAAVLAAFNQHGVLVFHDQFLTLDEQVDFARRFGPLELHDDQGILSAEGKPIIVDISNVDQDGVHIRDRNHPQTRYLAGNEGWHSDSSFKDASALASVLAAKEVTTAAGQTEFADMRAAYDALPAAEIDALRDLSAWHSLEYAQIAVKAVDAEASADPTENRGAWHPILRHHPTSGRDSLFIGRHASAVRGMELAPAQALLTGLIEQACQPPRTYAHYWTAGDVVIWDNRCVLHRATSWDLNERRVLRHVRIAGPRWP